MSIRVVPGLFQLVHNCVLSFSIFKKQKYGFIDYCSRPQDKADELLSEYIFNLLLGGKTGIN